jgi:putative membrane protein
LTSADDQDALRRTRLANERTFLAWLRSGLTAFAVSLAVGGVVPQLVDRPAWPFVLSGSAFALYGVAMILVGAQRARIVERATRAGGYAPLPDVVLIALAAAGAALGIVTLALVIWL